MHAPLTWLEINAERLRANARALKDSTVAAGLLAVVKANAYGAGAIPVSRILAGAGVDCFAVATVDEGIELRKAGITEPIVCLTWFTDEQAPAFAAHGITPTLFTRDDALQVGQAPGAEGLGVWVKVDTGMSRLGIAHTQVCEFVAWLERETALQVRGVYSTLVESAVRDPIQIERFAAVRQALHGRTDIVYSLLSSHGIVNHPGACHDLTRSCALLFGYPPSHPDRLDLERFKRIGVTCALTWKSRIAYLRRVPAGDQIGYGDNPALTHDTRIAAIATGWAEGYAPAADGSGLEVLLAGRRCRVRAVSANTTLVEIEEFDNLQVGDEAVLLGVQGEECITPDEVAAALGSVYRMFARVPASIPRKVVE